MARTWDANQVRLTLFVADQLRPAEPSMFWERLSGSPPDTDEYVRVQNLRRQIGPDRGNPTATLELQIQINRIDWILAPVPSPEGGFPSLGSATAVLPAISSRVAKWAVSQPYRFTRVAVAPTIFFPVPDRIQGYREILQLVPSLRFEPSDDISDLGFQINRRSKSSALAGMAINKFMKWSVSRFQGFVVEVSPQAASSAATVTSAGHFCRVDLDINTVPFPDPGGALDSAALPAIFEELSGIAQAISLHGELA